MTMRVHTAVVALWAMLLLSGCLVQTGSPSTKQVLTEPAPTEPQLPHTNLTFLMTPANARSGFLEIFAGNLTAGDYLFVISDFTNPTNIIQTAQETKKVVKPGVHVKAVVVYNSIAYFLAHYKTLPKGIDIIAYDYEAGPMFSPEFNPSQEVSNTFFDLGRNAAHEYGAKFMVTPPYGQLRQFNWDYGEAAKHMDQINIQFQGLVRNMEDYRAETNKTLAQIAAKSPTTQVWIQTSLNPQRASVDQCIESIDHLRGRPIEGPLVFYLPQHLPQVKEFFEKFQR